MTLMVATIARGNSEQQPKDRNHRDKATVGKYRKIDMRSLLRETANGIKFSSNIKQHPVSGFFFAWPTLPVELRGLLDDSANHQKNLATLSEFPPRLTGMACDNEVGQVGQPRNLAAEAKCAIFNIEYDTTATRSSTNVSSCYDLHLCSFWGDDHRLLGQNQ